MGISDQLLDIEAIIIKKTISNQVQLNWIFPESQENALRVYEYRRYYNGSSCTPSWTTGNTIVHTPDAIGKYVYEIKALDLSETSSTMGPLTKEIEITQQDIPLDKQTVQVVSQALIRRISINEILLSWAPNTTEGIKSYEVLIDDESLIVLSGSTQQYTHNIQQTGHLGKCIYKLIARDQNDREYEPYYVEFEITTSYLQVEKIVENIFELNWAFLGEDVDAIEFYNVYRDSTSLIQAPKNVTTFSDTTLLSPGTYTYRVEAFDESGSSLGTPAIAEMVVVEESYLQADVITSNEIRLSWKFLEQENISIALYDISRDGTCITQIAKEETMFTDRDQLSLGEYTYTVEALDSSRNVIETKQVIIKIDE